MEERELGGPQSVKTNGGGIGLCHHEGWKTSGVGGREKLEYPVVLYLANIE